MNTIVQPLVAVPRWLSWRPELGVETLALLASLFFSVFCNGAFWDATLDTGALHGPDGWMTGVALFVAMSALHMLLLCALLNRWTAKPVLTVLLLVTAMAVHFMGQYRVYLDPDMVRNILHTDGPESRELLSSALLPPLVLYGLLPALLVWRVRLRPRTLGRAVAIRSACVFTSLLVAALAILVSFQSVAALMRNHRELRYLITPGNYIVSLSRVVFHDSTADSGPRIPVGTDANVATRTAAAKPRLLILVIGETARAQNWGLNGYARRTTPQLHEIGPINFSDVTACGSSTEISLPCMFSPYGRAHYDKERIERSESLLHVLEHAGIHTLWRDNQTGCKGVCEGLAFESFEHAHVAQVCDSERCLDEVMLRGLDAEIAKHPGDMVVVLHQLGNHGPSYYKRYPGRLRRFQPTCDTPDLGRCSGEQIVNSYDNAILYTDDFLARTIRWLAADTAHDSALIYVSDHGESLGENGLYLHGVPYAIAPETQTRVPMLMWISPGLAAARGLDLACLRRKSDQPVSHDNLFPSVLGLLEVKTSAYAPELDLYRSCERSV